LLANLLAEVKAFEQHHRASTHQLAAKVLQQSSETNTTPTTTKQHQNCL
jgi:hypothetical protein